MKDQKHGELTTPNAVNTYNNLSKYTKKEMKSIITQCTSKILSSYLYV